jgi:hypothetical protein
MLPRMTVQPGDGDGACEIATAGLQDVAKGGKIFGRFL